MKRRDFSATLAVGIGGWLAGPAWAQEPVEGRNYIRLSQPAPVSLPSPDKKVDVVEFFWYECPHCYTFEPFVNNWVKRLPPSVSFRQVPVGFTARHQVAQKAYYALQEMGELDKLHQRIFNAIHVQRARLMTDQQYVEFAAANGVDGNKFADAMRSFSVNTQANRARQLADAYKIDGVPALGVHGRYYTSGSLAGTNERALAVADYLIEKVAKGG